MIGFANEMASVLYPKHDYVKEAECTMLSNIVKIGASILLSLPAAVVPFMAGPAAAAGAAGAGAAAGAAGVTTGMVASKVTSAANSAGLGFRNAISTRLSSMTKFVGNGLKSSSAGQLWSKGSAAATKWAKGPGRAAGLGKWLKAKATRGDKAWQKAKEVQSGPIGSMVSANAVTALLVGFKTMKEGEFITYTICSSFLEQTSLRIGFATGTPIHLLIWSHGMLWVAKCRAMRFLRTMGMRSVIRRRRSLLELVLGQTVNPC